MAMTNAERQRLWRERQRMLALAPSRNELIAVDVTPSNSSTVVTPRVMSSRNVISVTMIGAGFALYAVALILNSTYWASAGQTPLQAYLLMAAGVIIETVNFVGPSAIVRLPFRCAIMASMIYAVFLGMVVIAAMGFVSTNIGDSIAIRAVVIDHASATNNQRAQAISIAQSEVNTGQKARDDECGHRRSDCRHWEENLKSAYADLQRANSMPIADASSIASADPLATAAGEFGIPAVVVHMARIGGLVFVFSLASGALLWWGLALRG